MSISTCPRCNKQVLVPVDASSTARVRCPLCHEQYSLADALANLPPQLEVIEELAQELPAEPLDAPAAAAVFSEPLADVDLGSTSGAEKSEAESSFSDAPELGMPADRDDFTLQDQDTEIEDFNFGTGETPVHVAADEPEPLVEVAPGDESALDFDTPTAESPSTEVESLESAPAGDEIEIDFGDAMMAESSDGAGARDEGGIDFGQPQSEASEGDEMMLDFGTPDDGGATAEAGIVDFGEPVRDVPADDYQIVPDFGEPDAAAPAEAVEEPTDKKGKKKKEKKEKKKKDAADETTPKEPRKRSLVGTLAGVLLPLVITVPLALYGAMWLGPDYDVLKIGPILPGWLPQPKKAATIARVNPLPPPTMPQPAAEPPAAGENPQPQDQAPPVTTDAQPVPPATESPAAAGPADEPALSPRSNAPTPPEPGPAAEAVAAEKPIADESPVEKPGVDEHADRAKPPLDKDAAEMPDEPAPPKGDAANELDSLIGDDAKPATEPEEMPDEKPALEPTETVAEEVGPRDAGTFSPADLAQATNGVLQANEKMMAAQAAKDDAQIKSTRKDFYLSLYGLANVVALVKDDPARPQLDTQRQGLERLAMVLAADPKRLDALRANGARWLAFSKRTTPGVALAGTVQEVEHFGKLYYTKLQLGTAADAPVATLVSASDPGLEAHDEALSLGSILDKPDEQLDGYDGTDPLVVWSGLTLKLHSAGN